MSYGLRLVVQFLVFSLCLFSLVPMSCIGGPIAQGACYTACNAGYVSCLAGFGIVAGTTGPVGWWAWLTSAGAGCSLAQGTCMAACTPLFVAPTP